MTKGGPALVTSEERLKILKMVQEGKITAEEGIQLLESINDTTPKSAGDETLTLGSRGPRWFRVRVTDTNTGKARVNIRLPINVVSAGFKMGARYSPEIEGLDTNVLMEAIHNGTIGQIVDVVDEEDGEHVEVFLE
jgi:hypothetical protein